MGKVGMILSNATDNFQLHSHSVLGYPETIQYIGRDDEAGAL